MQAAHLAACRSAAHSFIVSQSSTDQLVNRSMASRTSFTGVTLVAEPWLAQH